MRTRERQLNSNQNGDDKTPLVLDATTESEDQGGLIETQRRKELQKANSTSSKIQHASQSSAQQQQKQSVWFLMTLFVLQNTISALLGRYNRTRTSVRSFDVSNMLIVAEVLKLLLSCILECRQPPQTTTTTTTTTTSRICTSNTALSRLYHSLWIHLYDRDALKLAIPASLYFIQNSLYIQAFGLLPVPLFQVTTHCKVILLAILSTVFLKQRYSTLQWISVVGLTLGISIVSKYDTTTKQEQEPQTISSIQEATNLSSTAGQPSIYSGLLLLWLANLASSIAAIYFERVIKKAPILSQQLPQDQQHQPQTPPPPSLWMRNIQLSLFSLPFAVISKQMINASSTASNDDNSWFFEGFTWLVCLQIVLFGVGGLLVAALIRSTSNVHKSFAMGVSVVVSTVLSILLFPTTTAPLMTPSFYLGTTMILMSVYGFAYGKG